MVPVVALGLLLCVKLCWGAEELRLVGGGGRCAGRVEVKHEGEWGSVCIYDFDWDALWATVVCRQLGCGPVAKASVYAPFGQGTGRIWLQPFFCRGIEETLQDCPHFGWGQHYCGHDRDVGVICADAVELRLAAGGDPCAGRVEMKLHGRWGAVADGDWDMQDAEVVCQQLGCGSAAGAYFANTHFGAGDGPINLAMVKCRGDEAAIWECEIRGWGPYSAIHVFDTAVICQGFARLVGGDSACAGHLEVRRGRAWVGVCEDAVDIKVAQVVCRDLGCGAAIAIPGPGRFEVGTRPFWEEGFECNGTEHLLTACARRPRPGQGCDGHASIVCSPYTGFRLAGNPSRCAGRVEVEAGGKWGSLCATNWDLPDANVLCQYLGCGSAAAVLPGGSFGDGEGPLLRDAFSCTGSERHPGECPIMVLGEPTCPPGHTAAVNCSGIDNPMRLVGGATRCDGHLKMPRRPETLDSVMAGLGDAQRANMACQHLDCGNLEMFSAVPALGTAELQRLRCASTEGNLAQCVTSEAAIVCSGSRHVRLAGGPGRCAGRVEVYVNGSWATICQDNWDMADATVVCHQLGCGTVQAVPDSAQFGAGSGPLWLDAGGCAGTEASLWDCPALAPRGCQRGGGAGVICSELFSVRLAGGSGRCSGHLEVLHNGTWGRVCANGTSLATVPAVCWQLGCGYGGRLVATPAQVPAPAWLAWVDCKEGARSLLQCPSAPWHLQPCSPDGYAHVSCDEDDDTSGVPTVSPGSTGVSASTTLAAVTGTVPVPTVLCVVLGTLLCLVLGALAVQVCRARCQGASKAADAISDAVYEELDYVVTPEYQEMPSRSGSPSEGSGTKLPCYTEGSAEERDPKAAPGSPAQPSAPDGYDDVMAVPPSAGDIAEEVAQRSWEGVQPAGGSCSPEGPPGDTWEPPAPPAGDTDYDDVGTVGTLP